MADRRTKEFQRGVDELLLFAFENGYDEKKNQLSMFKMRT